MEQYKLSKNPIDGTVTSVERLPDNAFIPFVPANTDYQKFKADVLAGAELQEPDGTPMTQEEADAYIATLP